MPREITCTAVPTSRRGLRPALSTNRPRWASQRGLSGTVNSSPRKAIARRASSPSIQRQPMLVFQASSPRPWTTFVDEQREEDAGDDPELKERAQPSARFLWCDLGDVNRADDRRRSDPQPAQKPRGEELLEDPG